MAKRLIKIAKELNVGTSTIVEHLTSNGFEIENKPTAKISDDMYTELLKEFQKSIAIKEKADQLVIGNRPAAEEPDKGDKKASEKPTFKPKVEVEKPAAKVEPPAEKPAPPAPKPPTPEPPASEQPPKEEPQAEQPKQAEPEQQAEKQPGLKVLGKINLDANKKGKGKPAGKAGKSGSPKDNAFG